MSCQMKLNRIFVALMLVIACAGAQAQVNHGGQRKGQHRNPTAPVIAPNPQSLSALQNDLSTAIQYMEAALPIYDGNRVKAIHAAHRALAIVDKAINANAGPRNMSKAKDHVASGSAKGKYNNESISQSQPPTSKRLRFRSTLPRLSRKQLPRSTSTPARARA